MSLEAIGSRMRENGNILLDYVDGVLQLTEAEREQYDIRVSIRRRQENAVDDTGGAESVYVVSCERENGFSSAADYTRTVPKPAPDRHEPLRAPRPDS